VHVVSPLKLCLSAAGTVLLHYLFTHTKSLPTYPSSRDVKHQIRYHIVEKYYEALAPNFYWIVSDPMSRAGFLITITLGYINLCLGLDAFASLLEDECPTYILSLISFSLVRYIWYFIVVVHACEAVYIGYLTKTKLNLKVTSIVGWVILTLMTGFPTTRRVVQIVNIKKDYSATHNSSKSK